MRRPLTFVLVAALTALGVACSSFTADTTPASHAPVVEAGADVDAGATCEPGCGATEVCRGGQCVPGCADGIVYVAPTGSDENTGCDKAAPKATLTGAIAFLKTLGAVNHEIHACRGTYAENGLVLDYPVSLRGGYECSLWTRIAPFGWTTLDASGHATAFDATNLTTVAAGMAASALEITGAAVTNAFTVDGFTFQARDDNGGTGVLVHGGAAPKISDNVIIGAAKGAQPGNTASAGVFIDEDATPEITHDIIEGGGGMAPSTGVGSTGIYVAKGAPLIHDNEISSGNGQSKETPAIGVYVQPPSQVTGANGLARNSIFYSGTAGVFVFNGAQADILDNGVFGQSPGCTVGACNVFGIVTAANGSTVLRNRVFAGDPSASAFPPALLGIFVGDSATGVTVANNLVGFASSANVANADGIAVTNTASAVRIEHNTIVVPGGAPIDGIFSVGLASIDENLIVGARYGVAVVKAACTGNVAITASQTINDNAFVETTNIASVTNGLGTDDCGNNTFHTTVEGFQLDFGTIANGNVQLSTMCVAGSNACHACASTDCFADVFATSPPTLSSLIAGAYGLQPNVLCALATGGGNVDPLLTTDYANVSRTTPVSIGALEDNAPCSTH